VPTVSVRPVSVTAAAVVQALEGFVLVAVGIYVAYETIVGQPRDLPSAIALAVITVLTGVLLVLVGRGLLRTRRWSRAPAVMTQLFTLIVAAPMVQAGRHVLGVPLIAVAVIGLLLLLAPATGQALAGEPEPDAEPESEPPRSDSKER
jgi:hypothetical protein